ncbi:MAG: hypothetical protein IJB10_05635 [Clostridia bacterium]|nr:hypothetical protein [Clostridia bacterium]
MFNVYKYKYVSELEQKYQNHFKLCSTNKITLLPPILKKVGIIYYLAFLVIEDNIEKIKTVKRPIGVILINKNTKGKEQVFDFAEYEYCKNKDNFEHIYYTVDNNSPLWPNKSEENKESFKIILDYLRNIASETNIIKKPKKEQYDLYLNKIKNLIPLEYWDFYTELEKKEILSIDENIIKKRKLASNDNKLLLEYKSKEQNQIIEKRKFDFKDKVLKNIFEFTKEELIPSLKGKGSYTKLIFFDLLGKTLRKFIKESSNYENCYKINLSENTINANIEKVINQLKFEAIKNYSKACKNVAYNIISVDTLSKVLIVFLNAMLVEEIQNTILPIYEDEIAECIQIFNEDKEKIKNIDAKKFLSEIFNKLTKDYYTADEQNLSDIYYAYSSVFSYIDKNKKYQQ